MNKEGIVYLVGAGPGDHKLLTIKGKECIEKADVVVYDRLVNDALLNLAPPEAEIVYAGKSPGGHTLKQHEINELLVTKAEEGKIVVRLKGGDPFVFGRGGEEVLALKERGISFEIVPGITSAVSVPAYAGIPVTHRGITSTVTFITGNEDPEKEDSDIKWDKLAGSCGTLVFLMGRENLPKIADKLILNGMSGSIPVAVIQWGTLSRQKTVTGTLENIAEKCHANKITNPAVIVVGEVVGLRDELNWFEKKPLFGKRVLVTRSRTQASVFADLIEEMGGEAYQFPTIEVIPPEDYTLFDEALKSLKGYDWIIFTSVNGVDAFFRRLFAHGKDARSLGDNKIAAIGPKTGEEVNKYGLQVDFMPEEYRAEAVIEGLGGEELEGKKILLPRADIARRILPEELEKMGAKVDEIVAYKTVMGQGDISEVKELLSGGDIDVVTFTSSSTVKNFLSLIGRDNVLHIKDNLAFAAIGPITAQTAAENGIKIDIKAEEYTIPGLLNAIVEYYNNQGRVK